MKNGKKKMSKIYPLFIILLSLTSVTMAQTPSDRDGLLSGEGMGQALYAEISGYPGPKHVLEFADTLQLTPQQKESVQKLYDEVKTRAKQVGKRIVELEEEFIDRFRSGIRSEKEIRATSERIGKLRGQLRAVHLITHVKTKRVLTEEQIYLYKKVRGYNDALEHHRH